MRGFLLCVVVLMAIAAGILLTATKGGLAYFSPFTLEYETQTEITLFNGSFVVYRSNRQPIQNQLVEFLRASQLVTPEVSSNQRWELVFHWNEAWKDGHGSLYRILIRYRDPLIAWSKADPERAKIYWSEAFKCLRSPRERTQWAGYEILQGGRHFETIDELKDWIARTKKEYGVEADATANSESFTTFQPPTNVRVGTLPLRCG